MRVILLIVCIITTFSATGQPKTGYALKFKIEDIKDTTAYLGYYYDDRTYVKDTARVNGSGVFSFEGKDKLPQGFYFISLGTTLLFDFVLSDNQHFSINTKGEDYRKNLAVTGDPDNKLFIESMQFNMQRNQEAEPWIKILQDSTIKDENKKKEAREAFVKINEKVMEYQNSIIHQYPNSMTARFFKVSKRVDIPEPPVKADGTIDSTFQLRYYREHFFDNFDLSDDALIRLPRPAYKEKVTEYLDKLFAPSADTLIKAIDKIVAKAKKNQETYKFLVWTLMVKYQTPEYMGLDAVYVHLFDTYFGTGEMDFWVNEKLKGNLKDYADNLRKSLIGMQAPNLIMQDLNLKPRELYSIKNKYTIVYFFDPDCGHCREETPKLVKFYNANKARFDLEVFAVSIDTSLVKMKNFIKDMGIPWITVNGPRTYVGPYSDLYDAQTTPTLYILDNRKKIIGKKLAAEKLENFLVNYERFQRKKAESGR